MCDRGKKNLNLAWSFSVWFPEKFRCQFAIPWSRPNFLFPQVYIKLFDDPLQADSTTEEADIGKYSKVNAKFVYI